jgi:hypothetical protein
MKRAKQNDEINQTKCWIATHGRLWKAIKVFSHPTRRHPRVRAHSRRRLAAIDAMELQLRDEVATVPQASCRANAERKASCTF